MKKKINAENIQTVSKPLLAEPAVSTRFSSYQKLKLENQKLQTDIYDLVRNADKYEGITAKAIYNLKYDTIDACWFGSISDINKDSKGGGIFSMIETNGC